MWDQKTEHTWISYRDKGNHAEINLGTFRNVRCSNIYEALFGIYISLRRAMYLMYVLKFDNVDLDAMPEYLMKQFVHQV